MLRGRRARSIKKSLAQVPAGQIVTDSRHAQELCIICEGEAVIAKERHGCLGMAACAPFAEKLGREKPVRLRAGDYFGEACLGDEGNFKPPPRCISVTDVLLYVLTQRDFDMSALPRGGCSSDGSRRRRGRDVGIPRRPT